MTDTTKIAIVAAAVLVLNSVYAMALPGMLEEVRPGMPFGIRESESPTTDAEAEFVTVTSETGIDARRMIWRGGDLPYPAVVTGGLAASDVDDDGWVDLYFPPGGPDQPARLYMNQGDWTFEDATREAGLQATGFGAGAAFGDYDNDGDSDLVVLVGAEVRLYEQTGNASFRDVSEERALSLNGTCNWGPCQPSTAAWTDYDRDGDLDLYVVNNVDWHDPDLHTSGADYASLITFAKAQRNVMFENKDNGTFAEVTRETKTEDRAKGLSVSPADVNRDGWPDLLTANDITPNSVLQNRGDGTFVDVAPKKGLDERKSDMGINAQDLTGNGRPDIVASNFRGDGLTLYVQDDDGSFEFATRDRGLGSSFAGTGWGTQLFDYNLDGWLDVAMAVGRAVPLEPRDNDIHNEIFPDIEKNAEDQIYHNLGDGFFAEATETAGAFGDRNNTRALLAVDLDNDGDKDVVRTNLQGRPAEVLRNDLEPDHNWIRLDFEGTASNRDGFGTRVEVRLPTGEVLDRELVSVSGYQTGVPSRLTVGLGDAEEARVTVYWPSGTVQDLGLVEAGTHDVVEPTGT